MVMLTELLLPLGAAIAVVANPLPLVVAVIFIELYIHHLCCSLNKSMLPLGFSSNTPMIEAKPLVKNKSSIRLP